MVSVVINYCSNEKCFIHAMLTECVKFSDDIVVSYGSHLYNGNPEDMTHIYNLKLKYPNIKFVRYEVNLNASNLKGVIHRPTAYWHNLARWTGVKALKNKEWVFILDADEIPDGDLVKKWFAEKELIEASLDEQNCYKIANYWYFKYPTNQSTTLEDSVLLMHHKYLTEDNIFRDWERDDLIKYSGCKLVRQVKYDNNIMFHHFSFVRSKSGIMHKLKSWAHCDDIFKNTDVGEIVEYIYKDHNVNDIIHGYSYKQVKNKFNICLDN